MGASNLGKYQVSDVDFKRYKQACERLCTLMGLQHFSRRYKWHKNPRNWAMMSHYPLNPNIEFSLARSRFVKHSGGNDTPELLAAHECMHAMLIDLIECMTLGNCGDLDTQEENFVRRFENLIAKLLTPEQLRALGDE